LLIIVYDNLHIVLVHRVRWTEVREEMLGELSRMIERVSRAKSFALSRAGLLPDHIHLTLGCPIEVAPAEVVLAFLNSLAFVHGMKPADLLAQTGLLTTSATALGPMSKNSALAGHVWYRSMGH
jgi:REP element-mobilizing transposase RayT